MPEQDRATGFKATLAAIESLDDPRAALPLIGMALSEDGPVRRSALRFLLSCPGIDPLIPVVQAFGGLDPEEKAEALVERNRLISAGESVLGDPRPDARAGLASLTAVRFRPRLGLDDSLDVFAVHDVAATLGALLTGVLASKGVNPDGADGSLHLLGVQAIGVLATYLWSGTLSFGIIKLVGLVTPLRADEQDEWSGMDMVESGERAYISTDLEGSSPQVAAHAHGHAPDMRRATAE